MIINLPTPDGTKYSWVVTVPIENVDTDLHYKYNARSQLWSLDVYVNDVALIHGSAVRPGKDILAGTYVAEKPPGVIWCVWPADPTKLDAPGLLDFSTCAVYYLSLSEFPLG